MARDFERKTKQGDSKLKEIDIKLLSMVGQDVEVSDQHSQIPPFLYTFMGKAGEKNQDSTSYIY